MRGRVLGALAVLALLAGLAGAETLGELVRARGVPPPGRPIPLDEPMRSYQMLDDARDLLVIYVVGEREAAQLHAARWERAVQRWTAARLDGPGPADGAWALDFTHCRSGLAIDRFSGGFLVRAHINPSAECTIVLAPDLTVRAVLAGWPVATLADGRVVYQRNQRRRDARRAHRGRPRLRGSPVARRPEMPRAAPDRLRLAVRPGGARPGPRPGRAAAAISHRRGRALTRGPTRGADLLRRPQRAAPTGRRTRRSSSTSNRKGLP